MKIEKIIAYIIIVICVFGVLSIIYLYAYEKKIKEQKPKFIMFNQYEKLNKL